MIVPPRRLQTVRLLRSEIIDAPHGDFVDGTEVATLSGMNVTVKHGQSGMYYFVSPGAVAKAVLDVFPAGRSYIWVLDCAYLDACQCPCAAAHLISHSSFDRDYGRHLSADALLPMIPEVAFKQDGSAPAARNGSSADNRPTTTRAV